MVKEIINKTRYKDEKLEYFTVAYIDGQIDYFHITKNDDRIVTIVEIEEHLTLTIEDKENKSIMRNIFKSAIKYIEVQHV